MNRCHKRILFFTLAIAAWFFTACRTTGRPPPGYGWVPVESALSRPSENQKQVLSSDGPPHAVWITPSLTVMWVYCQDGSPTNAIEFSDRIEILGKEVRGRRNLCEKPVRE